MKKRKVLLSVALGTVCIAGSAAAANYQQMVVRPNNTKIMPNRSVAPSSPVWPDNTPVKCSGINSCKGMGSCKGASNSCAGKNPCKGQGWVSITAAECNNKGGKILASTSGGK